MARPNQRALAATWLLGGVLFFAGALILETSPSGGLTSFPAEHLQPRHHASATQHPVAALTTSCVESYGMKTLAQRAFAFDGSVVARHGGKVTFRVHEWYLGGHAARVTVTMARSSADGSSDDSSEFPPTHRNGERLLVSGEPRWGGRPLAHAYAWNCGFTRNYSAHEAARWGRVFGHAPGTSE